MNTKTQPTMRAISIKNSDKNTDGPENLIMCVRPRPVLDNESVLIKGAAAGINRPDILQRKGLYPPPAGVTDIPGLEVAGEIIESKSDKWAVGDKVCALVAGGGYAEYVTAPAGQCLPVPPSLSMTQAAALPETVFTVWNNIFHIGQFKTDETVLIHGGSSGIGTTAIQMVKAAGGTVITTAGSDEKCDACIKLGADLAINYRTHSFKEIIEKEYGPRPLDIVLDMVGGDYVPQNISLLKNGGRQINIAFLNGIKAEINIAEIMRNRITLTGSTLRAQPTTYKTMLAEQIQNTVWPWIDSGLVKPQIYKTFPLSDTAKAHALMETSNHIGKIVLEIE